MSRKIKIGIVTTYDEINFGAFLQAYSLQKIIKSIGYDAEFINYKSIKYKIAEFLATYKIKNPLYLFRIIIKGYKFNQVLNKLNISKKYNSINEINMAGYDIIIFGSDEIWNLNNCLGGIIDTYYFGEDITSKKISYAVSFGSTKDISVRHNNIIKLLERFTHISLRDLNSKKIIENLYIHNSEIVLDPTLLITQEVIVPTLKNDFIFYYCFEHNSYIDNELMNFSIKNNLQVISFGYRHNIFNSIISINPFEWLGYLKKAKYVVTDAFHGSIFSTKFKKKFVVIMTKYRENKLGYLLDLLKLRDRIYIKNQLENILTREIDYYETNKILRKMKKSSIRYLLKSINDY